jgi:tetratricopeptide (TPR) repeat protein
MKWVLLLLLALPGRASAAPDSLFEAHTRKGIDLVYNLDFEGAEREFGAMVSMKPSHPAGHFFLAMAQWWRILIDIENEEHDERFHEMLDDVIDLCDRMLEKNNGDVTALFFKGGAIGFKGRLETHRSEWLAAANAGRKALPIVQEAYALDPGNDDILLGMGIYNYYAEIVPREYPFVKPLMMFVPPGDRVKGIQQLTRAAERGKYASVEATYFLMQLSFQFERDYPRALLLAERLHDRFPDNMLFHKYVGRCHVSLGNWVKAREVFREIFTRCGKGQRGYNAPTEREAVYYLGLDHLGQQQFEEALKYFYRCDELSRSLDRSEQSGFMVMANLRVGNIYDIQGKRDLARAQYRKVLDMKEYQSSHVMAEQYLATPFHH